jgi:hypothetical protein
LARQPARLRRDHNLNGLENHPACHCNLDGLCQYPPTMESPVGSIRVSQRGQWPRVGFRFRIGYIFSAVRFSATVESICGME